MKYIPTLSEQELKSGTKQRTFDFCHYMIVKHYLLNTNDASTLHFKLKRKSKVSIYIYEGNTKETATGSLVPFND